MVGDIKVNGTQKLSAAREAPAFMDSDYDENDPYQVDKISLEENKEKLEWFKREFEYVQKNSYEIEKRNYMIHIHDKEVSKIAKYDILHDIINPPKRVIILRRHYCPLIRGCMNTRNGRAKF